MTYETSDINHAAVLKTFGQKMTGMQKGYKCSFVFSEPKKCENIVMRFINNDLVGDIRKFIQEKDELMSLVKQ